MPNEYKSGLDIIDSPYWHWKLRGFAFDREAFHNWRQSWWGKWLKSRCPWADCPRSSDG